ncbi:hypothetical protein BDW42DRAFT_44356 [Aspergillus taichungensis]|uniref:Uncharacterized protein n=1 Tax=Aspergillus taichungensis TaxID=482145 RepID=A0A2J5I352_9EURO|nr:hypothetical protein BDW42DRAFT_44356 [Aspergillus taichungensis]
MIVHASMAFAEYVRISVGCCMFKDLTQHGRSHICSWLQEGPAAPGGDAELYLIILHSSLFCFFSCVLSRLRQQDYHTIQLSDHLGVTGECDSIGCLLKPSTYTVMYAPLIPMHNVRGVLSQGTNQPAAPWVRAQARTGPRILAVHMRHPRYQTPRMRFPAVTIV